MRVKRVRFDRLPTVWQTQPLQQHFAAGDPDDETPEPDPDEDPDDEDPDKDPDDEDPKTKKSDDGDDPVQKYKRLAREKGNEAKATKRQLSQVKKLLGLEDGDNLSPDQLQQKMDEKDAAHKATLIDNAVLRATPRDVDVEDLTDSRKFMAKLDDLDPSDDGFAAEVQRLVKAEVKARGLGGDDGGSTKKSKSGKPVGDEDTKPKQLTQADLKKMSPQAIVKAQKDGQLRDLMGTK